MSSSKSSSMSPYLRFALMIATSAVVMYAVMYLHTYEWDHIFWSQTRMWMTLIMVSAMVFVMMPFMRHMYQNRTLNIAFYATAALVFLGSVYFVRSQTLVDDVAYMRGMIPHHSIAILTSRRAHIEDPRVRTLADDIIDAQVREIAEMKALIADLTAQD